jgi:hypothetical protein
MQYMCWPHNPLLAAKRKYSGKYSSNSLRR